MLQNYFDTSSQSMTYKMMPDKNVETQAELH